MDDAMVDIRGVSVVRRGNRLLSDITLSVSKGEFVSVIGPNGAGKTTLLTLVNGLAHPSAGTVHVLGQSLPSKTAYRLRKRIGYVAQVEHVDPRLPIRVRESVLLGAAGRTGLFHRLTRDDGRKADAALELTGLTALADQPLGQVSGGEYQRAAIARVLVQEPELFLFDEPTASLDPQAQEDLLTIIEQVRVDRNVTAIHVTHDLNTIPQACDRIVLIKDGCIWREGARNEMLAPALLTELYARERRTG
jgi:ABC-type Mn2+/Zn2+ transport system ATPase subunit